MEILTQDTTIFFSSYGFVSRTDWTNENHKLKNVNSWNKTRLVRWQGGHQEITSIRTLRTDLNAVPPHDKLSSWIRVWLWLTASLMRDLCSVFVFSDSCKPKYLSPDVEISCLQLSREVATCEGKITMLLWTNGQLQPSDCTNCRLCSTDYCGWEARDIKRQSLPCQVQLYYLILELHYWNPSRNDGYLLM